jgi:coproporphyrinogen III oxidase-like Fe-S oxidoreductase
MWLERLLRTYLGRLLAGEERLALERKVPPLQSKFQGIDEFGLYLHIPFCRQICPYCPYNKEIYDPETARAYTSAVKKEIDVYSELVDGRPVTSLYIGGGTPTTMLHSGLGEILEHLHERFDMQCEVHLESHPTDLSPGNLEAITSLGVKHLSIGVEALQERHLRTLARGYTVEQVKTAVRSALAKGFKCVNVDFIFALPGQTCTEVAEAGLMLVEMDVDQIAAYPLFRFPYTKMGQTADRRDGNSGVLARRRMLSILTNIFYEAGFERTSVWAFTRPGVPKYCSVTVPLYVGLGASGGSYLKDVFYLNTFNVGEYIKALQRGSMPIALAMDLSERMQMAGWLYWRIYETRFRKGDFSQRFGRDFDEVYGRYMRPLRALGFVKDDGDKIVLSDEGAFWLHALEDLFSIQYVSRLWGTSKEEPWPERVNLG